MKTRGKRKYEKGYKFEKLTLLRNACINNGAKYGECTGWDIRLFGKHN